MIPGRTHKGGLNGIVEASILQLYAMTIDEKWDYEIAKSRMRWRLSLWNRVQAPELRWKFFSGSFGVPVDAKDPALVPALKDGDAI